MSARPLAASVAPHALGYGEQVHIQRVENPRRGSYALITPTNSDASDATSAQQEIYWCAEVASKMGILSVATSYSWRTDPT